MKKILTLKPENGLVVRDPVTMQPLPASGAKVEMNTYWQRRLNDGDVTVVTKTKKKGDDDK